MISVKKFILWVLVPIWLFIIIFLSSMNSHESSILSRGIAKGVLDTTMKYNYGSTLESEEIISLVNNNIRKLAHVTEYFILSILFMLSVSRNKASICKSFIVCFSLCLFLAMIDEIYQTFIPGRVGSFSDFFLDGTGVFLGCISIFFNYVIKGKKYKERELGKNSNGLELANY